MQKGAPEGAPDVSPAWTCAWAAAWLVAVVMGRRAALSAVAAATGSFAAS
jgi:hypothetical protein